MGKPKLIDVKDLDAEIAVLQVGDAIEYDSTIFVKHNEETYHTFHVMRRIAPGKCSHAIEYRHKDGRVEKFPQTQIFV